MKRAHQMLMLALTSQNKKIHKAATEKSNEGCDERSKSNENQEFFELNSTEIDDPSSLANVNTLVEVQDADLYEAKDLPGTSNEFQRQLDNLLDTDSVVSDACQRNDFDSDDDLDDPVPDFHLNSDSDLSEETERAGQLLEANLMGEKVNRGVRKLKKNTGQGYINSSGKFVASKEVRNLENCRLNCKAKILPEVQRNIFEQYWKLGNYNLRVAFAAGLIILSEKKTQRKTTTHLRNRTHVNTFFLEVGGERIQVCQKCFRFTLCETEQFIKTVVKKKLESPGTTISQDRRGRKIPPNKLNDAKQIEIRSHIQSFPAYESHYTRKQSQQKYLHADLSLSQMYRLFTEKYGETVSLNTYSKIFKTMNIKFKKPQLDTCNKCETFHMKLKTSSGNEKKQFEEELKAHQEDADLAYDSKKKEKIRCQNDQSKKVFTFDLQQCLPTPFLRTNISFYKRQLWTYNLTVHDGATNQPFCYMWHEGEGRRGGNEIASCLFEHLKSLPETCNQVVFYSDCCGGQNKNSFVSTMFLVFMQTESSIQTIDHKFLVPGHTHMECDTDHAAIERKKKRTSVDIHHPRDWYQFVRTVVAKKPFVVNEMSREKFFDFSRTSKEKFLWRKVDESGNKFIWQQIKWVRYEKKFAVIMYKTSLSEEEPFKILNLKRRGVLNVLPSDVPLCYMEPLALSKEKKKDLMDLLPLIDTSFHSFYKNLPSTENIPNYHPDLTEETDNETS